MSSNGKGPRLNPHLLRLPLYVAGKSVEEVQEELGLDEVLKLASNENPLGASPRALDAAREALLDSHRYPGIADRNLRRYLAPRCHPDFDERYVLTGNGATDLIRLVAQGFVFDAGELITSRVTFPLYFICATMFGGRTTLVPPGPGLQFDLAAMAAAIGPDTRLVVLCSPNNPTGLICRRRELDDFLRQVPDHVVVVLDESYRAFVDDPDYPDPVEHIAAGRNVIALRSFSKAAGLANLRVGYALARPELIEYLNHAHLPFNTGALALTAALASLDDHDFFERTRQLVQTEREFMYAALDQLDLCYLRSQANFVLITQLPLEGRALADRLAHRGLIVRPMESWGVPHALRVTLGTREQNERLVAGLQAELRSA